MPKIEPFSVSAVRPDIRQVKSVIWPDTGSEKSPVGLQELIFLFLLSYSLFSFIFTPLKKNSVTNPAQKSTRAATKLFSELATVAKKQCKTSHFFVISPSNFKVLVKVQTVFVKIQTAK
jgi:hypothetical protein